MSLFLVVNWPNLFLLFFRGFLPETLVVSLSHYKFILLFMGAKREPNFRPPRGKPPRNAANGGWRAEEGIRRVAPGCHLEFTWWMELWLEPAFRWLSFWQVLAKEEEILCSSFSGRRDKRKSSAGDDFLWRLIYILILSETPTREESIYLQNNFFKEMKYLQLVCRSWGRI